MKDAQLVGGRGLLKLDRLAIERIGLLALEQQLVECLALAQQLVANRGMAGQLGKAVMVGG